MKKVAKQKLVIAASPEIKHALCHRFGLSYQSISNALNYRTGGDVPDAVRKEAIALGGRKEKRTVFERVIE